MWFCATLSLGAVCRQSLKWGVFMRRLYLSRTNKKLAGVCGGLAEYLDIDPTIIRLIFVFLLIITGIVPMLIVYLIAWAVIPQQP